MGLELLIKGNQTWNRDLIRIVNKSQSIKHEIKHA